MADKAEPKEDKKEAVVLTTPTFHYGIGRRRVASARVRLYVLANEQSIQLGNKTFEKGQIIVNDRPVESYFPGEVSQKRYLEPYRTTNTLTRFVTTVRVDGGGPNGQLEAFIHGLARALIKVDPEKFRPTLKKHGFLTRDPRAKQRRKAGFAGKSRKKKQSPKR